MPTYNPQIVVTLPPDTRSQLLQRATSMVNATKLLYDAVAQDQTDVNEVLKLTKQLQTETPMFAFDFGMASSTGMLRKLADASS